MPLCGLFSGCRERELLSRCCAWASHCGGFSCCRTQTLVCRLQQLPDSSTRLKSCGAGLKQLPDLSTRSGAVVHGLQQLPDSRALAQELWCTGFVAPRPVGSSWTRDGTCVSLHWQVDSLLGNLKFKKKIFFSHVMGRKMTVMDLVVR